MAFERELVGFFVEAAALLGVPKSVAAIYGVCFATPEPLSFADVVDRLDISQGSVSQGLRALREIGAIRPAETLPETMLNRLGAGDAKRREFYTPDLELRKLAAHFIEQRIEKQLNGGKDRLQAMKSAIPPDDPDTAKELKGRLKCLQSWHEKGSALVPLVKGFLKLSE